MAEEAAIGEAILERVVRLGRVLQARGNSVALSEIIDAAAATGEIDLGDREQLRAALQSTLVKQARSLDDFNNSFDRLFPSRPRRDSLDLTDQTDPTDPAARLADGTDLDQLATDLVDAHAGLEGDLTTEGRHLQRTYRGADLARLMSEARKLDPDVSVEELRARVEELKRMIANDLHELLGQDDELEMSQTIEDLDFLNASRAQLDDIRHAIEPLARRIASKLARRRQSMRSGRVDLRRTARKSISSGGVPIDVVHARPAARKPELFVLCDISGSVADFSVFILTLVAALSEELAKTRSFVFVDAVDEITALLKRTSHGIEPWQILRNTNVIGDDGHSNYGAALTQFWDEVGNAELRGAATVLLCGDGRTNYRADGLDVLDKIDRRVRRVYWFNPEPKGDWDTDDSAMDRYAQKCSEVFEVRTLAQLQAAVEAII
jgi:uncharacterized protein with von Willebrand factor type A (vWA) domain